MPAERHLSAKGSRTRTAVIDATEALMLEEGYAGVTYRAVAARAGVNPGNVQYYFPTLDELFLGLLRERTQALVDRINEVAETKQPLRTLWEYASNERGSALLMEFLALGNHREAISHEIGQGGERVRQAQLAAVKARWADYGIDEKEFPPAAALFLIAAIPRMLRLERAVGTTTGHQEVLALVQRHLDRLEPGRRARKA